MHASIYNKIPEDKELISIIPTRYKVDEEIVKNPINMIGNKLIIKAVIVISPKNNNKSQKNKCYYRPLFF